MVHDMDVNLFTLVCNCLIGDSLTHVMLITTYHRFSIRSLSGAQ